MTGVVNVITKSPREAPGTNVSLQFGGFSRDAGSTVGKGMGQVFGANATYAAAPNATWSYRVSAGYFNSDAFPRPTGQIPVIQDPRDPTQTVGGAFYPVDSSTGTPGTAFQNSGTSQPKFDARVDQEIGNGRITYAAGVGGSSGIAHLPRRSLFRLRGSKTLQAGVPMRRRRPTPRASRTSFFVAALGRRTCCSSIRRRRSRCS